MIHFNPQPRVEIRRNATPDYIFEWLMEKVHIHKKDWFRTSAVMLMEDSPLRKKLFEMMEAHRDINIRERLDRLELEAWRSMLLEHDDWESRFSLFYMRKIIMLERKLLIISEDQYRFELETILYSSSPRRIHTPQYHGNDFRRAMMNNRGISTNS